MSQPINFQNKLELFSEHWSPKVIAEMNDYQFKLVKIKGEFTWHNHTHTDETFIVLEGSMGIEFRDRAVQLSEGEMIVVRRGEEHKPFADEECMVLLVEPKGVVNTGDAGGELTAENGVWVQFYFLASSGINQNFLKGTILSGLFKILGECRS